MNLPNKLTMFRIIMVPLMIVLFIFNNQLDDLLNNLGLYLIGVIFLLGSFTDFLDGHIARKRNIVTTFGKFIDPLADKLLMTTAMIILSTLYYQNSDGLYMWMPFYIVMIFIARDLTTTSIRMVAMSEGEVVAAHFSGKIKTVFITITFTYYFFIMPINTEVVNIIGMILTIISAGFMVWSAIDYLYKSRKIIFKQI